MKNLLDILWYIALLYTSLVTGGIKEVTTTYLTQEVISRQSNLQGTLIIQCKFEQPSDFTEL